MTSSYRDPNITAALAYQAEQEQRRKAQEQPNFLDIAGRTALGLGARCCSCWCWNCSWFTP
jgi:hypothetical protein